MLQEAHSHYELRPFLDLLLLAQPAELAVRVDDRWDVFSRVEPRDLNEVFAWGFGQYWIQQRRHGSWSRRTVWPVQLGPTRALSVSAGASTRKVGGPLTCGCPSNGRYTNDHSTADPIYSASYLDRLVFKMFACQSVSPDHVLKRIRTSQCFRARKQAFPAAHPWARSLAPGGL